MGRFLKFSLVLHILHPPTTISPFYTPYPTFSMAQKEKCERGTDFDFEFFVFNEDL